MTLQTFDQFPGHSLGYSHLPEELRRQIVTNVPLWSQFIRQESERFGQLYFDMSENFDQQLNAAELALAAALL